MGTIDHYLDRKYKYKKNSPVNSGESVNGVDKIENMSNNISNRDIDVQSALIIKCSECNNILGLKDDNSKEFNSCLHCGKTIKGKIGINMSFSSDEIINFYSKYNLKIKKV